jgi:hypothetical protein
MPNGEQMYSSTLLSVSVLEGGRVASPTPRLLYPWERPGTHWTGGWVRPGLVWMRAEISPPPGFNPWTVLPIILGCPTPLLPLGLYLSVIFRIHAPSILSKCSPHAYCSHKYLQLWE